MKKKTKHTELFTTQYHYGSLIYRIYISVETEKSKLIDWFQFFIWVSQEPNNDQGIYVQRGESDTHRESEREKAIEIENLIKKVFSPNVTSFYFLFTKFQCAEMTREWNWMLKINPNMSQFRYIYFLFICCMFYLFSSSTWNDFSNFLCHSHTFLFHIETYNLVSG